MTILPRRTFLKAAGTELAMGLPAITSELARRSQFIFPWARARTLTLAAGVALLLLMAAEIAIPVKAVAQDTSPFVFAQAWGHRYSGTQHWGVDARHTTPNPSISTGQWTAGPVGVSDYVSRFIESGPTKACDEDCGLHPYWSWGDGVSSDDNVNLGLWLAAGGWYRYRSFYLGGNIWRAEFCPATGCVVLGERNLGINKLPYAVSGGESSSIGVRWGILSTDTHKYKYYNSSTWTYWCYTGTVNNVGAAITLCSNWTWSITY